MPVGIKAWHPNCRVSLLRRWLGLFRCKWCFFGGTDSFWSCWCTREAMRRWREVLAALPTTFFVWSGRRGKAYPGNLVWVDCFDFDLLVDVPSQWHFCFKTIFRKFKCFFPPFIVFWFTCVYVLLLFFAGSRIFPPRCWLSNLNYYLLCTFGGKSLFHMPRSILPLKLNGRRFLLFDYHQFLEGFQEVSRTPKKKNVENPSTLIPYSLLNIASMMLIQSIN